VAATIGPAEDGKGAPGQAEGKDHFAGDGVEAPTSACAMVRERILGVCKGTITVDQNKINADSKKAKENVQAFGDKTKEAVGADTEKVRSEDVPADADQPVNLEDRPRQ
jgi:hypothetical protein